jgi:hypothetical protein
VADSSGNALLRVLGSGNVGIGTTTPAYRLDVNGTIASIQARSSAWTSFFATPSSGTGVAGDTNSIVLRVQNTVASNTAGISMAALLEASASNKTAIVFSNDNGGGTLTEKMRITADGNVGIGTSSPDQRLVVQAGSGSAGMKITDGTYSSFLATISSAGNYGNGSLAGQLYLRGQSGIGFSSNGGGGTQMALDSSGNLGISGTATATRFIATTTTAVDTAGVLGYNSTQGTYIFSNSGSGRIFSLYNGNGGEQYVISTDYSHIWYTNTAERMRITSAGDVGIGTSSPGAKLQVNGSVAFASGQFTSDTNGSLFTQGNTLSTSVPNGAVGINQAGSI